MTRLITRTSRTVMMKPISVDIDTWAWLSLALSSPMVDSQMISREMNQYDDDRHTKCSGHGNQ